MHRAQSQVVWKFIGMFRGETTSQIVIPSCDPPAKVGDLQFVKLVCGKAFVGEDADASKMVQDCFQVEVGTAGPAVAVRDSKHPDGPLLAFPAGTWKAFTAQMKATA